MTFYFGFLPPKSGMGRRGRNDRKWCAVHTLPLYKRTTPPQVAGLTEKERGLLSCGGQISPLCNAPHCFGRNDPAPNYGKGLFRAGQAKQIPRLRDAVHRCAQNDRKMVCSAHPTPERRNNGGASPTLRLKAVFAQDDSDEYPISSKECRISK